ncbi:P-loop ATPase, Sll1717 family [Streptomyces althioticus]|uniref:P-loop ATPase, Sll1717 family n=1 Tax=Streptomyces althioticus TaxID=83380 RepID=UPI0037D3400B
MHSLFFGYSASPEVLRETLYRAASEATSLPGVVSSVSWEELQVDGRLIINEVEAAIMQSSISLFDLTTLSSNVLYELGYAIAQEKRVVLLLDEQDRDARKKSRDFSLLSTTGWTGYRNADHLKARISSIVASPPVSLWEDLLLKNIEVPIDETRVLYIPSLKEDDASRRLSRTLDRFDKFEVDTIAFDDYANSPLAWYTQSIYQAKYAIFHFTPSRAYLSELANPRVSLLAGIARGLGREVVLLMEESEETPVDYRDLAIKYRNAGHLENRVNEWMEGLQEPAPTRVKRTKKEITAELASLRFGSHVAESDKAGLEQYFVETRDYRDVLDGAAVIFTGKKGTGKTANMQFAGQALAADARNLVCPIKPASYEIEALLEVLRRIDSRHLSQYLIEGLWKYLIYTEIASRAVEEAEDRPAGIPAGSPLDSLRKCLEDKHFGVSASLSSRLERLVGSLNEMLTANAGIEQEQIGQARKKVGAALYGEKLSELRILIGQALASRNRVAMLVDNLDKAWEKGADLELLSRLILGLLTVIGRVVDEFHRENPKKESVNVTLTVFLRSDIFAFVRDRAREPDKISVTEIEWRDKELLARVLEDRFVASRDGKSTAGELWTSYFTPEVKGMPTRDYMLSRVQPRPRDLVFFANAAVDRASNARHAVVGEKDILEAERDYSQFAYEAILVEGVASSINLEDILIEFAGEESIVDSARLDFLISQACDSAAESDRAIGVLRKLGFLGIEVGENEFDYGGTEGEMKRANVRSRKFEKSSGRLARYQVHPAYRSHLMIADV